MARPGEPAETYCSLGPGPRLAVGARAVCPPGAQPGQGSSWLMTLRKALPRRPARGASPRTARPAPPAAAPRGCRAQPMGTRGADNTQRSGCRRQSSLAGSAGGVALGAVGGGATGAADKDCASRARPRGAGKGQCGGHAAHWSREPPYRAVRGVALARCLDGTLLLNLIVLARVMGTRWRAHVERRDSPRPWTLRARMQLVVEVREQPPT